MKTRNRNLLLAAAGVALIGVAGAAGTFAYLQDDTEDVVNTFSPNSVTVELSESDKDGEPTTTGRNDYSIVPGTTAEKDPKVTVTATLDSYVFVEVSGNVSNNGTTLVEYKIADGWEPLDETKYPGVYYREVDVEDESKEYFVLSGNEVSYPASLTNDDMVDGIELVFKAYAIQKVPFSEGEELDKDGVENAYLAAAKGVTANNYIKVDENKTLAEALEEAKDGDAILLTSEVELGKPLTIKHDVTIVGDETTVVSKYPITTAADVTFKNITFEKPENVNKNATCVYGQAGTEDIVFDGCTFSNPQWEAIQITSNDLKSLVVKNCEFRADAVQGAESSYGNTESQAIRFIHVQPTKADGVVIAITNNQFYDIENVKDSIVGIYYASGKITVGGNSFEGWGKDDFLDTEGKRSGKLSVGWPEVEDLKTISLWEGDEVTYDFK